MKGKEGSRETSPLDLKVDLATHAIKLMGAQGFMKSFSGHLPFGTQAAYAKEIMASDLDKLASLIRVCGFLMQTKIYLFWNENRE